MDITNEPWYRSPEDRASIKPYVPMDRNKLLDIVFTTMAFAGLLIGCAGMFLGVFLPETLWGILMLPGLAMLWIGTAGVVLR